MDLKNLSSNWKKLQGALKKDNISSSSPAKRKTSEKKSDHRRVNGAQHGVKRKRTENSQRNTASKLPKTAVVKRSMSGISGDESEQEGSQGTVATEPGKLSRRNSTVSKNDNKSQSQGAKPNEGLSST